MKSRYLTNVLLILLVAGLYWFNSNHNTTNSAFQAITDISSGEIQHIIIERAHLDNIILEKRSHDWLLLQPFNARANSTRLKLLLSLLATPSYAQLTASDEQTLAQLDLSPAKITLNLNKHHFQFGGVETISNRRYVLHNGIIHLVDDQVSHLLNASAASFIDNRLIPANNVIDKISLPIRSANGALSKQYADIKNNNGSWVSNQTRHPTDQLTALISRWQHSYALQVLPIKHRQDTTIHKVTIWYKNNQPASELKIKLTDKTLSIYDPAQQLQYQFPAVLAQQLFPTETMP